ncbi:MAG: CYTH domain-containing protein [Glaciecola sp.]
MPTRDSSVPSQTPLEVELKLIALHDPLVAFEEHVLPNLNGQVHVSKKTLKNQYFDTPDQLLRQHKMGLRVRSANDEHEQTLKLKGSTVGGLHQRPEYNLPLSTANVDIRLFDADIWPVTFDINGIQEALSPLFTTHFHRTTYHITDADDNEFEVVFDVGEVATDNDQHPINEIELELVKGLPNALFELANSIAQHCDVRVNNLTKAAYGYALVSGKSLQPKKMAYVLPINQKASTEAAFETAAAYALKHWQHNQTVYVETYKLQALTEMVRAIRLLLQVFSLYLPVLQCKALLSLHRDLIKFLQSLHWQDEIHAIRYLRSRKGPFSKRLNRDAALMSYLQGRKEGILNAHAPQDIIFSTASATIQLDTAALLLNRPWSESAHGYETPVIEHAHGWLSQGWQTLLQAMPNQTMKAPQYLSAQVLLRQTLLNGFMLAGLFDEDRERFRAPWLDLAMGMEELNALALLKHILQETDLDDKSDLLTWTRDKTDALLNVMEMTRNVALNAEIYW